MESRVADHCLQRLPPTYEDMVDYRDVYRFVYILFVGKHAFGAILASPLECKKTIGRRAKHLYLIGYRIVCEISMFVTTGNFLNCCAAGGKTSANFEIFVDECR
jgi:hypothetical protein